MLHDKYSLSLFEIYLSNVFNRLYSFGRMIKAFTLLLLIVPFQVSAETVYFSDDFESGNLSKWTYSVPKAVIQSTDVNNGNGSLFIPFDVAAGGDAHLDNNRFAEVDLSSKDIEHYFLRGCVMMSSKVDAPRVYSPGASKKLFFIFSENQGSAGKWDLMVSMNGGVNGVPLSISVGSNYYPEYSDLSYPEWEVAAGKLQHDRWHCLEVEMKLNTPGQKNGLTRLWVDGVLEFEKVNISIRSDSRNLGIVRVGAQLDRHGDNNARAEDRYWDDIKVSDTFSSIRPNPPINLAQD